MPSRNAAPRHRLPPRSPTGCVEHPLAVNHDSPVATIRIWLTRSRDAMVLPPPPLCYEHDANQMPPLAIATNIRH